jgi:hypothetical protein
MTLHHLQTPEFIEMVGRGESNLIEKTFNSTKNLLKYHHLYHQFSALPLKISIIELERGEDTAAYSRSSE